MILLRLNKRSRRTEFLVSERGLGFLTILNQAIPSKAGERLDMHSCIVKMSMKSRGLWRDHGRSQEQGRAHEPKRAEEDSEVDVRGKMELLLKFLDFDLASNPP